MVGIVVSQLREKDGPAIEIRPFVLSVIAVGPTSVDPENSHCRIARYPLNRMHIESEADRESKTPATTGFSGFCRA